MKMKKPTLILAVLMLASFATAAPTLNLPTGDVTMFITHPGAQSYWGVAFSGIGGGYDIHDGTYIGWCADADTTIGAGSHQTKLYSIYETLPSHAQNENWTKINYMVDKYRDGGYSCATKYEIQTLIWSYLGYDAVWGSPNAACMDSIRSDVDLNGDAFEPGSGDVVAVLCDTADGKKQLIFIELPYFLAPEVLGALAAIGLASPAFGYLLVKRRKRK